MPPAVADLFAQLAAVTSLSAERWQSIHDMPEELQAVTLANYRDQGWATQGTSTFDEVMKILGVIGTVAGVASGVGGAIGIIRALT